MIKKTCCGFSKGRNQYWAGRVYDLCVYYMTGTPEGSTEIGFMEKPVIEPATPGKCMSLTFLQFCWKHMLCLLRNLVKANNYSQANTVSK